MTAPDWKRKRASVAYCWLLRTKIPGFGQPSPKRPPGVAAPAGLGSVMVMVLLLLLVHLLVAAAETAAAETKVSGAAVPVAVVRELRALAPAMELEAVATSIVLRPMEPAAAVTAWMVPLPAVRGTKQTLARAMTVVSYLVT